MQGLEGALSPKVYTLDRPHAKYSAFSWPDTVRKVGVPKKSLEKSTAPASVRGRPPSYRELRQVCVCGRAGIVELD